MCKQSSTCIRAPHEERTALRPASRWVRSRQKYRISWPHDPSGEIFRAGQGFKKSCGLPIGLIETPRTVSSIINRSKLKRRAVEHLRGFSARVRGAVFVILPRPERTKRAERAGRVGQKRDSESWMIERLRQGIEG